MTTPRPCSFALLGALALGCGPKRGVDDGDSDLACLDLPPLGAPTLREITPGPNGERVCDDAPDAPCFVERTYPIESVWRSVSGDFDGDGFADIASGPPCKGAEYRRGGAPGTTGRGRLVVRAHSSRQ